MKHFVALCLFASATTFAAGTHWVGTWATAAQPAPPEDAEVFENQTLRLIVHVSIGGKSARIRVSNAYGNEPLVRFGTGYDAFGFG